MRYVCDGYWEDTVEAFKGFIIDDGSWEGDEGDDDVFFYTDGEPVIGQHLGFVITSARVL